MSESKSEYVLIHVKLRRDLYEKIWEEIKRRYVIPTRKLHVVINEAIEEYFRTRRG